MSTVNQYNTSVSSVTGPAMPVNFDPKKYAEQEMIEKDKNNDPSIKAEPKIKTAKAFSTEKKDMQILRPNKEVEKQKSLTEEIPEDAKEALSTKEGIDAFAKVLEDYANNVHNVNLKFEVHEATGEFVIRVYDEETDEIIREVPPEELLDLAAKMEQMMGVLLDEKV